MSVLGLLISSSLSRGKISWDGSSWRRLQMCGQLLWTTERKAWSRTMLAAQPIAASWSPQNNFYVDAMFENSGSLSLKTAYIAAAGSSLSNHFLELWSSDHCQIAWMQRWERFDPPKLNTLRDIRAFRSDSIAQFISRACFLFITVILFDSGFRGLNKYIFPSQTLKQITLFHIKQLKNWLHTNIFF